METVFYMYIIIKHMSSIKQSYVVYLGQDAQARHLARKPTRDIDVIMHWVTPLVPNLPFSCLTFGYL